MQNLPNHTNYDASQIKVLTLAQAVRKRPGMYLGDIDQAATNMVLELVANAIDIFLTSKQASYIKVKIQGQTITVTDNGGQFPFDKKCLSDSNFVEHCLTQLSYKPTVDNHTPHIHLLIGGAGLAVMNAASLNMTIECCNGQKTWQQAFALGEVLTPASCSLTPDAEPYATIQTTLDPEIFQQNAPDNYLLHQIFFESVHLYPGLHIEFKDEHYYQAQGLKALAHLMTAATPKTRQFYYHKRDQNIDLQLCILGETTDHPQIKAWVNGTATVEFGSHVDGVLQALKHLNWQAAAICVHVMMLDPKFAAPSRDRLAVPTVTDWIREIILKELDTNSHSVN
ncbi:MAG: hypothetical protein WBP46_16430 [Thiolinea sp.]